MRYKCRICRGGADRNICYIHIVGRSHSDPSQKYLAVSDFFLIFPISKIAIFDLKEANEKVAVFNGETSLFSSFFSLFPTIKSKNAFFEVAKFFSDFFYF